jgi:D-mannonate dehydratase
MKKDPKHIPGKRWTVKYDEKTITEGISKLELRGVIKELINEMWYGSKNDVEGDETHDESLNEILNTYDSLINYVSSLPQEEQIKISWLMKEKQLSAYDAVLEYIKSLGITTNSVA